MRNRLEELERKYRSTDSERKNIRQDLNAANQKDEKFQPLITRLDKLEAAFIEGDCDEIRRIEKREAARKKWPKDKKKKLKNSSGLVSNIDLGRVSGPIRFVPGGSTNL